MTDREGHLGTLPPLGRVRQALARYPEAAAVVAYGIAVIVATITAYFSIFATFAPHDDEGTLLIGLRAFTEGDTLYRDIWSVYGPFYYEFFGGMFSLFGQEVTTDAGRTVVVVIWVATSFLLGLASHRLTGSLWLGLTGMIAAFGSLGVLVGEPMHPHGLCMLLLAALALLAACGPSRRPGWLGAGGGALLAALLLTKVNLGVFAIAAVVVAAAFTAWPFAGRAWIRWPVGAGFLAMPVVIAARDLSLSWTRELVLIEILAMAAVLVAARPLRPTGPDRDLLRWLLGAATGLAAAFVAILAVLVVTGPSPADAYDGIVRQALGIRDLLISPVPFPSVSTVTWAVIALAVSCIATWVLRLGEGPPAIPSALLRAVAGVAIWLAISHIVVLGPEPSIASPLIFPMLAAWIAVIPPAGTVEVPYKRFLRLLLPALAVAETLQIYPVAGSQMGIATVSFASVGALCIADALTELRAVAAAARGPQLAGLASGTMLASVGLAAVFALNGLALPAVKSLGPYRENARLDLPGASLVRLPAPTAEAYEQLVGLLHGNGCTSFVGYPGMGSLHLWSGLEAPVPRPPNGWFYALDDDQQRRTVAQLRASAKPCVIRSDELAATYLHGEPPPETPLVRYVTEEFEPVAAVGAYQFLLPKPSATDDGEPASDRPKLVR